jgi:L-glutamine-phosphate cytidylyltransferase
MRAVILAAGCGSRLKPYTDHTHKTLIPIRDTTLIHRTLAILKRVGVTNVAIVVGYLKEKFFEAFPTGVQFSVNEEYASTDQVASLLKAHQEFKDDLLVIVGDLLCCEKVYADILRRDSELCLAIERGEAPFNGASDKMEKVLFEGERMVQIGKTNVTNEETNGEFLGLTKISKDMCPRMLDRLKQVILKNKKSALIHVFQSFLDEKKALDYVECNNDWCEVDDSADLEQACQMLATPAFQ